MDMSTILEAVDSELFAVWFLIGAALVFFMQAGFAMVESGFTRAKNAGNIIMKNLMDFCIGTITFILLGFGLMMSENYFFGIIGIPHLQVFTDWSNFDFSTFVFNLVFCATTATIVSGSMAERTKFSSYCIYSAVISAVVYPIEAGWIWNGQGWLAQMGFHDFAGSCAIHMVGGISALIGAIMLGPRIGKYVKDKKTGKVTSRAILGHNIPLGALGCFILWFGWYGFNGAACTSVEQLGRVFLTTTMAPGVATVVCMIFTWIKNGKPDVSMCLNASLAGLVAITAPCDTVDALGSIIIGAVAGILVVVAVEVLDLKLHIDDPVGAVAVHMCNGIWGTIAVGLFSNGSGTENPGLFYGGGFSQLGVQLLGFVTVAAYTTVVMIIVFSIIKATNGLRVTKEEELQGLDQPEHGLPSAYADFAPAVGVKSGEYEAVDVSALPKEAVPMDEAVPVQIKSAPAATAIAGDVKFTKVEILTKEERFEALKAALIDLGVTGMTVSHVLGCGIQKGKPEYYRGALVDTSLLPKIQVEVVIAKIPVRSVIEAAKKVLYTGHIGDGKIFVYDVENVVKVRTGEEGYDALQDVE